MKILLIKGHAYVPSGSQVFPRQTSPVDLFPPMFGNSRFELAFERFASSSTLIKFQREEVEFYPFDLTRILNNRDNFNSRSLVEKRNVLNNREINPETILMGKSKISCRRGYLVSILKEIYRQNYILIEYCSLIIIYVTRYLDNFSNFTIKNFRSNARNGTTGEEGASCALKERIIKYARRRREEREG